MDGRIGISPVMSKNAFFIFTLVCTLLQCMSTYKNESKQRINADELHLTEDPHQNPIKPTATSPHTLFIFTTKRRSTGFGHSVFVHMNLEQESTTSRQHETQYRTNTPKDILKPSNGLHPVAEQSLRRAIIENISAGRHNHSSDVFVRKASNNAGSGSLFSNTTRHSPYTELNMIINFDRCFAENKMDSCKTQRMCSCAGNCAAYDDCCFDAQTQHGSNITRTQEEEERKAQHFSCLTYTDLNVNPLFATRLGYRIITSCPDDWTDIGTKNRCISPSFSDVMSMIPVYDPFSSLTYRNKYCRICHGVTSGEMWDTFLGGCPPAVLYQQTSGIRTSVEELVRTKRCALQVSIPHTARPCYVVSADDYKCWNYTRLKDIPPLTTPTTSTGGVYITESMRVAKGLAGPENPLPGVSHRELASACMSYVSIVRYKSEIYRNGVCSWCITNKVGFCSVQHAPRMLRPLGCLINATQIFDDKEEKCRENEVFDEHENTCHQLYCGSYEVPFYGRCIAPFVSASGIELRVHVYTACNYTSMPPSRLRSKVAEILGGRMLLHALAFPRNGSSVQPALQLNGEQYCTETCETFIIDNTVTFERIKRIRQRLKYGVTEDRRGVLTMLKSYHPQSDCHGSSNNMGCPHFSLNEERATALRSVMHSVASVVTEPLFVKRAKNFLICSKTYQEIVRKVGKNSGKPAQKRKYEFIRAIITHVLLSISLLLLLVSILTYTCHPAMRSIPCRISLHIMITLSISSALFLSTAITDQFPILCRITAIASHYIWLASFIWMSVYAVHLCRVFCNLSYTTNSNVHTSNKQGSSKKLILYCVVSYAIPLLAVSSCVYIDHMGLFIVKYGQPTCFIGNPIALLYTFAAPLSLLMLVNIVCFAFTVVMIFRFFAENTFFKTKVLAFYTCVKITCFLGLSWVFGIIAAVTDSEVLWFCHVIFSSSHGIFIFLSHILFSKLCRMWFRDLCNKYRANP